MVQALALETYSTTYSIWGATLTAPSLMVARGEVVALAAIVASAFARFEVEARDGHTRASQASGQRAEHGKIQNSSVRVFRVFRSQGRSRRKALRRTATTPRGALVEGGGWGGGKRDNDRQRSCPGSRAKKSEVVRLWDARPGSARADPCPGTAWGATILPCRWRRGFDEIGTIGPIRTRPTEAPPLNTAFNTPLRMPGFYSKEKQRSFPDKLSSQILLRITAHSMTLQVETACWLPYYPPLLPYTANIANLVEPSVLSVRSRASSLPVQRVRLGVERCDPQVGSVDCPLTSREVRKRGAQPSQIVIKNTTTSSSSSYNVASVCMSHYKILIRPS